MPTQPLRSELAPIPLLHMMADYRSAPARNARTGSSDRALREISKRIGGGGFGDVYQAIRTSGFAQKVAIKLIRQDRETNKTILARFEVERRVLADLQHENIARLLDEGSTEEGRPYFVMEYGDGKPITEYCDARRLPIRDRLRLFQQVCRAVASAHHLGVIHRDLKPAKILVTSDGTPTLVDFGIGKLTNARSLWQLPTLTESGLMLMTLQYAIPERATGGVLTTASDLYSLGFVLYEMLTGKLPYEVPTGNYLQAVEVIASVEPKRPSSAIVPVGHTQRGGSTQPGHDHVKKLAGNRSTETDRLRRTWRTGLGSGILIGTFRSRRNRARCGSGDVMLAGKAR